MIILGLLVMAVVIALLIVVFVVGGDSLVLDVFGRDIDLPIWGVFLAGVATGLVGLIGVVVLAAGIRRSRARREEIEYLRRKVAEHERATQNTQSVDTPDRDWPAGSPERGRQPSRYTPDPVAGASRPAAPTTGAAPISRGQAGATIPRGQAGT